MWHSHLGHVSSDIISFLNKTGKLALTSILPNPSVCAPCQLAKSKRLSFHVDEKRSARILDLVYCDLWGPAPIQSNSGFRFYVIFVDDHSRFTWLYPLHYKFDFFDIYVQFKSFVENQFGTTLKVFHSDGGTEFTKKRVQDHLKLHGIRHIMSCPYTPAQNGRAERKHRHITEIGLAMLFHSHMPTGFWLDAFSVAVYIINLLPSPLLESKSPFEIVYGTTPHYSNFHPFGCRVFPCLRDYATHKLSPRSAPCIFIGYISLHKGFRCLDTSTSCIYITRYAQFDELHFTFSGNASATSPAELDFSMFDDLLVVPAVSSSLPSTPPST